jgi:DNA-binding CsgD family transcriptional regulator
MAGTIAFCNKLHSMQSDHSVPAVNAMVFAESLREAGTDAFSSAVLAALNTFVSVDHCTLVNVAGQTATMAGAASRDSQPDALRLTEAYVGGYFLQDPLVREETSSTVPRRADPTVRSVKIDEASNAEYFERFFARPAISDKLSVVVPGAGAISFLNLYKSTRQGRFDAREKAAISSIGDFLAALTDMHNRLAATLAKPAVAPELWQRWQTLLSDREKSVARMLGRGETAKTVAAALNLSPTSVITYKKRAFAKLGIAKQSELVALVTLLG